MSEEDDVLVVTTEFAPLTDAIEEGTIEWDYQVRFDKENLQGLAFTGEEVAILAGNPDPSPTGVWDMHRRPYMQHN